MHRAEYAAVFAASVLLGASSSACNPFPSYNGLTGGGGGATDGGVYPCASAVLCENFEHPLSTQLWKPSVSTGSTAAIDSTNPAAHGASSLAIDAVPAAGGTTAGIQAYVPLPSTFHARFFVRIAPTADVMNPGSTIDFFAFVQNMQPFDLVDMRLTDNAGHRVLGIGNGMTSNYLASATAFEFGPWTCIEWEVGPSSMRVWVGGKELTDLATTNDPTPPGLGQVLVQVGYSGQLTVNDWWFDEIIVDTSPIGCDRFQEP